MFYKHSMELPEDCGGGGGQHDRSGLGFSRHGSEGLGFTGMCRVIVIGNNSMHLGR